MSAYTAPSQIAQRQLDYFADKHVLVAGEIEDQFPLELVDHCQSVTVFSSNYSYYRSIKDNAKITAYFGCEFKADTNADLILLYWPKAKAEGEYLLAMLLAKLGVDTEVVVVGENRSGVNSIAKLFAQYGRITKYDSARRCSFYWGVCQTAPAAFDQQAWFKNYSIEVAGVTLTIKSLPGVFSHGSFDLGSQLLLETLPALDGKVLDFGCGAGVIGAYMAKTNPNASVHLCDINAYALTSSAATLAANHLRGHVFASDIYSDISEQYQFIVSNPPFHSGLETNYNAAETLLGEAPNHLTGGGSLIIVANSFLKYPPIINRSFGTCQLLAKNSKFTIYRGDKTA
ncbi:16S rRNA (guanine(1207)-N(2))-methyltransferase RsmC [Vibrio sp. SM6]|uniref:Ribosomal RNA small subunit methyltransferase C n=1 Tax=Vibrio agarilyticus TaxID=2726741 RepID=A0A7X8YGJ2_9VIBR|nr:16S rRNA (guanine(1207)-N(2))-methyltransferase RsmC [Vibrio agarilyticus]NLS12744.1 16S rRNA (guanine(1207)-N(2))-methyltransferase RsmC [Vibrio agarilyticus]